MHNIATSTLLKESICEISCAVTTEKKLLLDLDDEALDKALQLVTQVENHLVPTFTGMLLIGKKEKLRQYVPTSEASFQAFNGTEISVNESFYLPILSAIEKIFAFYRSKKC